MLASASSDDFELSREKVPSSMEHTGESIRRRRGSEIHQVATSLSQTTCSGLAKAASALRRISTNFMSRHNTLCLDQIRSCMASLKSNNEAIAKTVLILETFTNDKKLIKLGALITIDNIREEMMKNHAMLEADDK